MYVLVSSLTKLHLGLQFSFLVLVVSNCNMNLSKINKNILQFNLKGGIL